MKCLDLTLPTPAENLACDEVLLEWCERGAGEPVLRFWEPTEYFIVLGYANRVDREVHESSRGRGGMMIYRRCSGGGTVVQGPGCLNYSLVLKAEQGGPLAGIAEANRFIMEKHRRALEALLTDCSRVPQITVEGHTDLAVDGLKCSGNAQRRSRAWLLFHGTVLLDMDLNQVERALPMPSRQPAYRNNRAHRDFLANLGLPVSVVKRALRQAWDALDSLPDWPRQETSLLARDKYVTNQWNFKF